MKKYFGNPIAIIFIVACTTVGIYAYFYLPMPKEAITFYGSMGRTHVAPPEEAHETALVQLFAGLAMIALIGSLGGYLWKEDRKLSVCLIGLATIVLLLCLYIIQHPY